jgi:protein SCO1/2
MKYFSLIIVLVIFSACKQEQPLPILGQREAVEKIVNGVSVVDTVYQTIPAFSFLNQDSTVVTNQDFDGTIYVADFFFTSCPTICPTMHRNLLKVYQKYKGNAGVKLLSHTIDVKYDRPYRLKAYANKIGVKGTQWEFLWGSRDSIYNLAQKSYLVAVNEDKNEPGGFVHQGYLILIDQEKRIRGAYDGTVEEDVEKLMKDMDILLKEYEMD